MGAMLRIGKQIRFRLAAILLLHWKEFVSQNRKWIRPVVFETVRKIIACRTPALGCHGNNLEPFTSRPLGPLEQLPRARLQLRRGQIVVQFPKRKFSPQSAARAVLRALEGEKNGTNLAQAV